MIGIGGVVVILSLIGVIFCLRKRARKIQEVGNRPVRMQYMETVDGSVVEEMLAEKKTWIRDWTQSQSGRPLNTVSELEGETLKGSTSGGRY